MNRALRRGLAIVMELRREMRCETQKQHAGREERIAARDKVVRAQLLRVPTARAALWNYRTAVWWRLRVRRSSQQIKQALGAMRF